MTYCLFIFNSYNLPSNKNKLVKFCNISKHLFQYVDRLATKFGIITNEVFEPIDWKDVPEEKKGKIFNLLILLLSTELHATLTGHIVKNSILLFLLAGGPTPGPPCFESLAATLDERLLPPPLPRPRQS